MMEKDGVRLTRIRAPQHDQLGFRNLTVRTGAAAQPEDCRQTDDTGGVSSAVAAIDIIASDDGADELLRGIIQLVGSLGATEHAERLRAAPLDLSAKAPCDGVERLIPGSGIKPAVATDHRLSEPGFRWNQNNTPFPDSKKRLPALVTLPPGSSRIWLVENRDNTINTDQSRPKSRRRGARMLVLLGAV